MKVNPVCSLECEPQTQSLRGIYYIYYIYYIYIYYLVYYYISIYYLVLLVPQQAGHSFPLTVLYSSPSLLGSSETFPYRISTGNC